MQKKSDFDFLSRATNWRFWSIFAWIRSQIKYASLVFQTLVLFSAYYLLMMDYSDISDISH